MVPLAFLEYVSHGHRLVALVAPSLVGTANHFGEHSVCHQDTSLVGKLAATTTTGCAFPAGIRYDESIFSLGLSGHRYEFFVPGPRRFDPT